jgi:DNA polymerase I
VPLSDHIDVDTTTATEVQQDEREERIRGRLVGSEYTEVGSGDTQRPVTHLFVRDPEGQRWQVDVTGHRPSFFVTREACDSGVRNHYAVTGVEHGYEAIDGTPLTRVYTRIPADVPEVRDLFDATWEADVLYDTRFLIDTGIYTGVEFPAPDSESDSGDETAVVSCDVSEIEPCDPPDVSQRVTTLDIEVDPPDDGSFPTVDSADQPVTAVTCHDSYRDAYATFVLSPPRDEHSGVTTEEIRAATDVSLSHVGVYDAERELLHDVHRWIRQHEPDVLTGWNSNGFDLPYLVNRSDNLNVTLYKSWSPLEQVWTNRYNDAGVMGVSCFDMLDGYRKTQIHSLKEYTLDYVAQRETGFGKDDVDPDTDAWVNDTAAFVAYNIRDVQAVVEVEQSVSVFDMFANLRDVTGALLGDCHNNIDMLDVLMLRRASNQQIRLPTSTQPDEDWYYGAKVFDSVAGRHDHVVYPDLSSLYPNMMLTCNVSTETLIGTADDLRESEYDEDDCVYSYIDTRPIKYVDAGEPYENATGGKYKAVVKKRSGGSEETVWADDPQYEKCYFVSPDIERGFVSGVVDDLLEMKEQYRGTAKYAAVKRVVNSVYGVLGDSNSYGRGFRLFDWRLGEAITMGGRRVITHTKDAFLDALDGRDDVADAYLVGGDTDSVMTSITPASSGDNDDDNHPQRVVELAEWAIGQTEASYDSFAETAFGVPDGNHTFAVDLESYARRLFIPADPSGSGTKKRYVSWLWWDEDDGWYGPDERPLNVKGFEAVRSDVADVTVDTQMECLRAICEEDDISDARTRVYSAISGSYWDVIEGSTPLELMGISGGLSQAPEEYGSPSRRPQPMYRGAKYADLFLPFEEISEGSKPMLFYVLSTPDDYPDVYKSGTAEDGDVVDAIAVENPGRLRDAGFEIDHETMAEKIIEDPLKPIFRTFGWSYTDAVMADGRLQSQLVKWM